MLMLIPLSDILVILEKYKYFVILPVVIIEGPIIMVISGFLVYLGFLNIFITYSLLVVGDLIGDSLYYAVGRYGSRFVWIKKAGYFLGYNQKIKESLKNHFEKHTVKTLLLAKISHGLGGTVQVIAGVIKVNFLKYLSVEIIGTIPKTLILLILGFYIGDSYLKINTYLDSIALIIIGAALAVFLYIIRNFQKKDLENK